ncbi:LacI family DNA-binding transcriptional regulator [Pelagerythrobacter marinus]|uniref:LacI family DNA-binding transcriptional regulator n=1 Tax=Pelagerythrobacter marinus TaxID=538382 RepID=A0ABW9V0D5_9SPHN|nr:LacI family DNA-binding transcriptional regulator [Pelagerythrobacter marinus]MXO69552.1 LacI family DNA-binding transcriptional regulator [Pelagerythrobacter marinus]USA39404.1 LacI family DNA-binding transcriptional regulator [Pelagerythrobacter marinus]WPZ06456.1 LacI family DNA-binding transcriptional regulator [Pelagerythrobacter marinus]
MDKSDKQPTINDVARVAGVSKKTVSRVINRSPLLKMDTREKVEAVIAQLGYVPNPQARALALRRNFLLGLLHDNPNAQTVLNFQEGVLDAIRETEFALVVRPVDRHSPEMLDDIRNFLELQRLYGVLILPPISEDDELAALCREMGCGYVRMGSAALDEAEHLVQSNDREMVAGVVDYLVGQGHRRIGLIEGPAGFRSAFERREGFLSAMRRHGLAVPDEAIVPGNYRFGSGVEGADRLLRAEPRITALFASNDEMAAGAYHAARERGVDVPRDLSIVGFDDSPIAAHIWPPMTTVGWPIREMGKAAALKLVSPDLAEARPSCFPARLVTRASVAPPASEI